MKGRVRRSIAGAAFLSAMAAAQASGAAGSGDDRPILLVEQRTDSGFELKVVGVSEASFAGSYRLEVTSGAGGNRSVQAGRARLQPRVPVTFVRLKLGNDPANGWSAVLKVTPEQGAAYEIALGVQRP